MQNENNLPLDRVTLVSSHRITNESRKLLYEHLLQSTVTQGDSFEFNSNHYLIFKCEPILCGIVAKECQILGLCLPMAQNLGSFFLEDRLFQTLPKSVKFVPGAFEYACCSWNTLARLGLFNEEWIEISNGSRMAVSCIYGRDDLTDEAIHLENTQYYNLAGLNDMMNAYVKVIPTLDDIPTANQLSLARVSTPNSSNTSLFQNAIGKLLSYFSTPRFIQQGDLICIDVNGIYS